MMVAANSTAETPHQFTFPLLGPAGEPVDLWRTLISHGMTSLPPMSLDEDNRTMELVVPIDGKRPRMIRIEAGEPGVGLVTIHGRTPGAATRRQIEAKVRQILRLDQDLSEFYELAADDPELAWVASGAGRMVQGVSVFEDVIKTICTTNCAWSATERMVGALCEHLGEAALGASEQGPRGKRFPTPRAMASADESFYRDTARAGYRAPYLISIARAAHDGSLDLEALGTASQADISDDELEARLLELPGVGPYAAAHIMFTLGRYSRLILDSWTRPKYAQLIGRESVKDAVIEKRFKRYGRYAGLAFWMFLTKDWVEEGEAGT